MIKTRLKFIVILAAVMVACLCAGCSIGFPDYNETLTGNNVKSIVTYYGNGGYFNDSYILSSEMWFTSGTKFYEIAKKQSSSTSEKLITRENYDLLGWYEVEQVTVTTDGEEKTYFVLDVDDDYMAAYRQPDGGYSYIYKSANQTTTLYFLNNDGKWLMSSEDYAGFVSLRSKNTGDASIVVPPLVCSETQYTGNDILKDDTHIYVAAKWKQSVAINYVLAIKKLDASDNNYVTVGSGEDAYEVKEGEVVYRQYFGTSGSISVSDSRGLPSANVTDGTLLKFYSDKDCTQSVDGKTFERGDEDITLYAQYVCGEWTMLRNSSNLRTMFNTRSGNYYLVNDIDCSDTYAYAPMVNFNGRIEGNGYTISNLKIEADSLANSSKTAIFGTVRDGAVINNLNFKGVTVSYTARTNAQVSVYLLFSGVDGSPRVDNVKVETVDVNITVPDSSMILNIQTEGGYREEDWLYDSSYKDLFGGISVSDYSVSIGPLNKLETAITDRNAD